MNTITLLNGIKSMFSSLGAKTSDSNYAVGLYDKTSAEPKGIMEMSSLASVLGVLTNKTQPINANSSFTIDKGDKTAVLYCWANTATSSAPAIIMCARKSLTVHVDSDSLLVNQDVSNSVCVNIDSSTGNIIVKNNHSSAKNFSYLLLRVE